MKILRMLAVLCMIGALVFSFAACGAAPVETTAATEATEEATVDPTAETEPLVDPATFKAFINTWYADGSSASYRIVINKDATWNFIDTNGEAIMSGIVVVNEDNVAVSLCDPDGVQIFDLKLEAADKLYVEIYADDLMNMLTSSYFLSKITNSEAAYTPITDEEAAAEVPTEVAPSEDVTEEPIVEETEETAEQAG